LLLKANFQHLLFLNYQVDRELLEPRVPSQTQLQLLNGKPYISLVCFLFKSLQLEGFSVPFHQEFEQVNLRFYVEQRNGGEAKHGVVFIREIVPRALVAITARALFHENYLSLNMDHRIAVNDLPSGSIEYGWKKDEKRSFVRALLQHPWQMPQSNSPEYFLTNRPFGFTKMRNGSTREITLEHPVWRTSSITDVHTDLEIPAIFGTEFVPYLTLRPTSAFLAEGSPVTLKG
jgi:uncharacterized protein YqjF (DUF2071 family)